MLHSSNYLHKSKYYDDSNKLVNDRMNDKTGGAAIEELIRLKSRMYSFLLDDSSEHK